MAKSEKRQHSATHIYANHFQEVYHIPAKDCQSMRLLVVRKIMQYQNVQRSAARKTTQTGCTVSNSKKRYLL